VQGPAVSASAAPAPVRPPRLPGFLAAGLLAATLVGVPVQIYRASALDFASASRDLLLAVFAAGLLAFAVLALVLLLLPARLGRGTGPLLVAVAAYAWTRSGFFPGPSVSLDGTPVTVDLSTGWAGLFVPLAGGALLAVLGARRPRVATTVLAALLAGSLAQSLVNGTSVWGAKAPASRHAVASLQEWSRTGNVFVLILDSLQSDVFEEVLEAEPRLRDELDGFRYYRLASSTGPTTYLSLPTIHGGLPYEPGKSLVQFYREAVYEGSVLNRLTRAGYRTSYGVGVDGCPKAVADCVSTLELARSPLEVTAREAAELLDIGVYRIAPDGPREAILRRGRGPLAVIMGQAGAQQAQWSALALERLASAATATDSPPSAKMVHSMLTHPPGVLRPDCSVGERRFDREGDLFQAQCAVARVVGLFERLRALEVYDVSDIVVLADHGFRIESRFPVGIQDPTFRKMVGAFNPTVLVKPAGSHGRLTTSDAPIELADLPKALCGHAGCSPTDGLRHLEAVPPGRTRTAFYYKWKPGYWWLPHIPGLERYSIRGDLLSISSWSREPEAYSPEAVIEFRRGGNLGPYLGFGWGYRQKTHTWMVDPEATVWLKGSFVPGRDYELVLGVQPPGGSPAAPTSVAVLVNGVEVGRVSGISPEPDFETHRYTIPAAVLARSPDTGIRFSAEPGPGRAKARLALRTLELRPAP
jgi:hypothetical protein